MNDGLTCKVNAVETGVYCSSVDTVQNATGWYPAECAITSVSTENNVSSQSYRLIDNIVGITGPDYGVSGCYIDTGKSAYATYLPLNGTYSISGYYLPNTEGFNEDNDPLITVRRRRTVNMRFTV